MTRSLLGMLALSSVLGTALAGPPVIDGSAADVLYGPALAVQDTQTGFGNSNLGRPDFANGSELDAAYALVYGNTLYLVLAGNFETNGNKVEIFFDTRDGGQNQLLATNPASAGLDRMKAGTFGPGLKFDPDFAGDFYVSVNAFGDPTGVYVDYAELYVSEQNPGVAYYAGAGQTKCATNGGALSGGDLGAPAILCTADNSNTAGVTGGYGTDDGSGVLTGIELAIPLSAIGNPTADFQVCAFINGQQHDYLSNQVLAGIFGLVSANLGEPQLVDFSTIGFNQFFAVPISTTPVGACCRGGVCSIEPEAWCLLPPYQGIYLGDNANCDGNPCDAIPSGACCVLGVCSVQTEADCLAAGGEYQGDGTDCTGCPCPLPGACCVGTSCTVTTEANCQGDWLGAYTNCDNAPCATGACCINGVCSEVREEVCVANGGRYWGDGTTCGPDTCSQGACCLDNLCFVVPAADCTALGGDYQGDLTDCNNDPCNTPPGLLTMDGSHDTAYGAARKVQDTQTQFGDSNLGLVDRANGSELDAAYTHIVGGRLYILLTGNLESGNPGNWNKLEIFFDTRSGGQARLLGPGINPNVDFGALDRMGDDGTGNGLTFDAGLEPAGFEPDFWLSATGGNNPYELYANYAELYDPVNAPTPVGYFLGRGHAADRTNGGLLDPVSGASNPVYVLATINNSNTAGVVGGTALIGPTEHPETVTTGIEVSIPLSAIGNPASDFTICAFVNGQGHDWVSNQILGPIGGGGNFGEPRNVSFANVPGAQWFLVPINNDPCAGLLKGDSNCDGAVNAFDIDPFVIALTNPTLWQATYSCNYMCVNDVNRDGSVNAFDIDPFVLCLTVGCP